MPKPTVTKEQATFYCRCCKSLNKKKAKAYKGYIGSRTHHPHIKTYVCFGLRKHINCSKICLEHYARDHLTSKRGIDISTSLIQAATQNTVSHSPNSFGLVDHISPPTTMVSQRSSPKAHHFHQSLNQHISRGMFHRQVDRSAIQSYLASQEQQQQVSTTIPQPQNLSSHERKQPPSSSHFNEHHSLQDNTDPSPFEGGNDSSSDSVTNAAGELEIESTNDNDDDDIQTFDPPNNTPNNTPIMADTSLNDREVHRQSLPFIPADPKLAVDIELMYIMAKHKLPLKSFKIIYEWAKRSHSRPGFDFATSHARKRKTVMKQIRSQLCLSSKMEFVPHVITWLPDELPTDVYIRPFKDALYSLLSNPNIMTENNLSFPSSDTPLSPDNYPALSDDSEISELHHGKWWSETWKAQCTPDSSEILVPIIFYMDGISLDARGRLSLTPLNMTLGIFNIETRIKSEAWETIYFHPDYEFEASHHSRFPSGQESMQNLHNGLKAALQSFHDACQIQDGILWDHLPYAGKLWKVRMKFAIA